jgi:anti-sigma factor RsiW
VSDLAPELTSEEMAELCALADGSLPADRRAEVEARVAASPELRALLERQRQAVLAAQTLAEAVPESLRASVEAHRDAGRGRIRLAPRIVLVGAGALAAAVAAAVVLSGGPGAPTVADAARLATESPAEAAPPSEGNSGTRLAAAVEGVAFPDFARAYGWRAVGATHGRIDGRDATAVYYAKDGRRLGYAIVADGGLPRPANAQSTVIRGITYQTLRLNDRLAVTWRRRGHTCVLIGNATRAELLKLASWPLSPR